MEVVESAEEDPMVIFRGIISSMLGLGKNQVDEAKRLLVQARSALSAMSPTRARQYTSEGRVDGAFGLWANHLVSFVAYNWLSFLTESEKKELFDVFFLDIGCIARDDGSESSDQIIVAPAGCFVVRALCQSLITAPSQLQAIPSSPSAEKKMGCPRKKIFQKSFHPKQRFRWGAAGVLAGAAGLARRSA